MGILIYYTSYAFFQAFLFYIKNKEILLTIQQNKKITDKTYLLAFAPFLWVENVFITIKRWWKRNKSETEM